MLAGCGNSEKIIVDSNDNNSIDAIANNLEDPIGDPADFVGPFLLDNDLSVTIISSSYTSTELDIDLFYNISGGPRINRNLTVDLEFDEATIFNTQNQLLYGYSLDISPDSSSIIQNLFTSMDTLITVQYVSGLHNSYDLNGTILNVQFQDTEDRDRAIWLYDTYDDVTILSMPTADQLLYSKLDDVNELMSSQNSFQNNTDAEIVTYLMNDSSFLDWAMSESGAEPNSDKICGWAGIIATVSCYCFLVPACALICAPSLGVALACNIADVL